jgi:hypothetical protein
MKRQESEKEIFSCKKVVKKKSKKGKKKSSKKVAQSERDVLN